jgi:glutamate formiminotransferase
MGTGPVLSAAVNLSEGRRGVNIDAMAGAAEEHTPVLDVSSDPDHNRTVVTLCGRPRALIDGIVAMAAVAVNTIDLANHEGVHPRLGAVDVVPLTPRLRASIAEADQAARECARRLWGELAIPCFFYESSARRPESVQLPAIRRFAFKALSPDVGGPGPHPTAGATVVGARGPLVAFNVNLATSDLAIARAIASEIRSGGRSLPYVRSLGLPLKSRGYVQVSMNLTRPDQCTVWDAYRRVEKLASEMSVQVASSEIVGVLERAELGTSEPHKLKLVREPKLFDVLYGDVPD